ncbi:MAG: cellulase family glycosylhydrolase [Candidatus Shapirobacteria bacterium]|jgi:hypothetical protein
MKWLRWIILVLVVVVGGTVIHKQYRKISTLVATDTEPVKEAATRTDKIKPLSIVGTRVIDTDGNDVMLVGITTDEFRFNPMHKNIETLKQNILEVKSWGVNLVVLYLQQPLKVNKRVDEIVELANWATENKMYTLIFPVVHETDFIPLNDRQKKREDVYYSPLGKNTEKILETLSKKLKNNVGVMYGMGAESHGVSQTDLYKRQLDMLDTVRKNSPDAVGVINGMEYGHYLDIYIANPPEQKNILYDIHQYVGSTAKDVDSSKCILPTQYFGKVPLIVGEFGGTYTDDFGSYKDLDCVSSYISSFKYAKLGFVVHTIDNLSRMGLFDWNNQITSKGKLLKSALVDIKTSLRN